MTTAVEAPSTTDPIVELRDWLADNWDPDLSVAEWWERLGLSGWAAPLAAGRLLRPRPQPQRRDACRANDHRVRRALGADGHGDRPGVADDRHARNARADRAVHPRRSHRPARVGASCSVSPARDRISPGSRRGRSAMATCGSSTVRRSGRRAVTSPISACCWPARIRPCRSIRASVGSRSTCTSPASRCARCAR